MSAHATKRPLGVRCVYPAGVQPVFPLGCEGLEGGGGTPDSIVVSGAGTSGCNGTYLLDGTMGGKPKWTYDSGSQLYAIEYAVAFEQWTIRAVFPISATLYTNDSTDDIPPKTGWDADLGGAPAPTLSY